MICVGWLFVWLVGDAGVGADRLFANLSPRPAAEASLMIGPFQQRENCIGESYIVCLEYHLHERNLFRAAVEVCTSLIGGRNSSSLG